MKKASWFFAWFFGGIIKFFAFCKGQRITKNVKIKGAAIVLSNHTSFYDFLYSISATYPRRVNFLAAKKMFYDPVLGFFLRRAKAIPKALLEADVVATMQSLKVLKNNGILGVFPEGQISPSAVSLPPSIAIVKLIKKAEVPVYLVKHYNASFVNPPWTKKSFRGRINSEVSLLFTTEDSKALSEAELYTKLCDGLYFNPYLYNETKNYKYHVTNIAGLEYLLYRCPNCGKEGLKTRKKALYCPACEFSATLNNKFNFGKSNIFDYYEAQRAALREELKNPLFKVNSTVQLESFRGKRLRTAGEGILTLTKEKYTYQGTIDDEEQTIDFDPRLIPSLPSDISKNVQIYHHGQIFQFKLTKSYLPAKYVLISEVIYEMYHQ